MGFRFNRRLRIAPSITLNLGKRGVSTSIGTTGAKLTIGAAVFGEPSVFLGPVSFTPNC